MDAKREAVPKVTSTVILRLACPENRGKRQFWTTRGTPKSSFEYLRMTDPTFWDKRELISIEINGLQLLCIYQIWQPLFTFISPLQTALYSNKYKYYQINLYKTAINPYIIHKI